MTALHCDKPSVGYSESRFVISVAVIKPALVRQIRITGGARGVIAPFWVGGAVSRRQPWQNVARAVLTRRLRPQALVGPLFSKAFLRAALDLKLEHPLGGAARAETVFSNGIPVL
jgi:hypothetical protein